jgi:hypothetical protein
MHPGADITKVFEKECQSAKLSDMALALNDFKLLLHALETGQVDTLFSYDLNVQVWRIVTKHIQNVCRALESSVSKFWIISKKFNMRGQKVSMLSCGRMRS